jgi:diguanylate cyclase (GGDEF)-like protein
MIFFDIDFFKEINDTYGHVAGDFVLKEMCGEIKTIIRDEDELFRYGGEEFVILAPFISKANAGKVAEKVRERILDKKFIYHEEEIKITLSLGVASIPDDDVSDPTALVDLADKRMFMAKKNGRNQVVIEG